jgi:ribose 5-phosphate isomerase B
MRRIALGSDMKTHLTDALAEDLRRRGVTVDVYGALVAQPAPWPRVGVEVAERVAAGEYDQGLLCCWTGTGISIAANKVRGIRAALCQDAETARGARRWNDANILVLSLRAISEPVAKEILEAWLATPASDDPEDRECLEYLAGAEGVLRGAPAA